MDATLIHKSMEVAVKRDLFVECAPDLMNTLLFNEEYADVIFIVQSQRVPAHSNILAASSEYFRAMFYGHFREAKKKEVHINERVDLFKFLIRYIYKGLADLIFFEIKFLLDIYLLADKYLYPGLMDLIVEHIKKRLCIANMAEIFNWAQIHKSEKLYKHLLESIDAAPLKVIRSHGFKLLFKEAVIDLIKRNCFKVDELEIFKAVFRWSKTHTKEDLNSVLPYIRFSLMQIWELRGYVTATGVLEQSKIESIINEIKTFKLLPFRNGKMHRRQIVHFIHKINSPNVWENKKNEKANQICIKLPSEQTVNCIELDLSFWAHMKKSTQYYIEISRNGTEWQRIIDYMKYRCFLMQQLFFQETPVLYIYIRFMKDFICSSINTRLYQQLPILENGVIAPEMNQTLPFLKLERKVERNNKGHVKIILGQPIYVNCIYSTNSDKKFKINSMETSLNDKIYNKINIKTESQSECVYFKAHTVVFIKLMIIPKKFVNVSQIGLCFNGKA